MQRAGPLGGTVIEKTGCNMWPTAKGFREPWVLRIGYEIDLSLRSKLFQSHMLYQKQFRENSTHLLV
jgi:hypothetical protein